MRRLLLSSCFALGGLVAFGQLPENATKKLDLKPVTNSSRTQLSVPTANNIVQNNFAEYYSILRDSNNPITSEDFSGGAIPAGWTQGGNGVCSWAWSTAGSQGQYAGNPPAVIGSVTAGDGFLILDTDNCNPGNQQNFQEATQFIQTGDMDFSAHQKVVVIFQHLFRPFSNAELEFQASNDGINWTSWDVRGEVGSNDQSPNPITEKFVLDGNDPNLNGVGSNLGSTIKLRWQWSNGSHYYWMVDDILITELPANDLTLGTTWVKGDPFDSLGRVHATRIPLRQAEAIDYDFSAVVHNVGSATQNMAQLSGNVVQIAGPPYNSSSTAAAITGGSFDTTTVAAGFSASGQIGNYTATLSASSENSDAFPFDNEKEFEFEVTNTVYGYDNNNSGGGIIWGQGQVLSIMLGFDIEVAETVRGLQYQPYLNTTDNVGTSTNGVLNFFMYDENFQQVAGASKSFVTMTPGNMNNWNTVIFDNPEVQIGPGRYYVGLQTINGADEYWTAVSDIAQDDNDPIDQQRAYIDLGNDGVDGFVGFTPFIRMITESKNDLCAGVTINLASTVDYFYDSGINDYTAVIDITTTGNGTPPYTYTWTGPSFVSGDDTNSPEVDALGTYTVVVSDANFCSATVDVIVDQFISVPEIEASAFEFSVFPNPNNGTFNLQLENAVTDNYTVRIDNILGQTVHTESFSASGNANKAFNLSNLEKGVYFFNLVNSGSEKTQRVVIR